MNPSHIISAFDQFLQEESKRFEAICIGGTALGLLGIISRETQDCDILSPTIPSEIKLLSEQFAEATSDSGIELKANWLNNGPASLTRDLPEGWESRTQLAYQGKAITLYTLGRGDLLKSKLFALCDRAVDRDDCIHMNPTKAELKETLPWLEYQDGNPLWPQHVRDTLSNLAKELGFEL